MLYKLKNGRSVSIPAKEIEELKSSLEISENEAIELWLTDNGFEENAEQAELDEKASKVHINKDAYADESKKPRKKPEIKVSSEKQQIFQFLKEILSIFCQENNGELQILNENKLFSLKIGEKIFKLDLIETRNKKNL